MKVFDWILLFSLLCGIILVFNLIDARSAHKVFLFHRELSTTQVRIAYASVYVGGLAGVILAFRLFIGHRRRLLRKDRQRKGLCSICGYDLRASADRCPECGATMDQIP